MITLNLLPDVKREFIKAQRLKMTFILGSLAISGAFIVVTFLLASFVFGFQRLQINSAQNEIDKSLNQLKSEQDLDKVLSIQKQLSVLPGLHDKKPDAGRLFDYLNKVVPKDVTLSSVEMWFEQDQLKAEISGQAKDPKAFNIFVDTLKNADYKYDGTEEKAKAFPSVIADAFSVGDDGVRYTVQIKFDAKIFDNTLSNVTLEIPQITTTASTTEKPTLFNGPVDNSPVEEGPMENEGP